MHFSKIKIPEKILNDLNKYIDEIIIDNQKLRQLNHGNKLIGDVTHEFRLDQDFSKEIDALGERSDLAIFISFSVSIFLFK